MTGQFSQKNEVKSKKKDRIVVIYDRGKESILPELVNR
jgi:hypothetical protein